MGAESTSHVPQVLQAQGWTNQEARGEISLVFQGRHCNCWDVEMCYHGPKSKCYTQQYLMTGDLTLIFHNQASSIQLSDC